MNRDKLLDWGLLFFRIALAAVMFYHGSQKLFGWFDGRGLEATVSGWGNRHSFPQWLGYLGAFTEFAAGVAVGLGLLTRVAALGLVCVMSVATWTHIKGGDPWNKIEFPMSMALIALGLVLAGAGRLSLDALIFGKKGGGGKGKSKD